MTAASALGVAGSALLAIAAVGAGYTLAAAATLRRFFAPGPAAAHATAAITVLKPLHGAEPRLADTLGTFLAQDHAGATQIVCGVALADDAAIPAVRSLDPAAVTLVIDPTRHGASGKVSNLVNMMAAARHDVLVLSDSDIAVAPDYLRTVAAALARPGVGAVTLPYRGRGDAGFWSVASAAGISWQFLPGLVFGVSTGLARPCMGSTIALERDTLDAIGGFRAFADTLADDHAIGEAVRALGMDVVVLPLLVVHGCAERSFLDLWRHEVRWGATVRGVAPAAYAASVIAMPLPLAVLGAIAAPAHGIGLAIVLAALAARVAVVRASATVAGCAVAPVWLLPVRDALSFAVYVASLFAGSVEWRGARFRMRQDGRMSAAARR